VVEAEVDDEGTSVVEVEVDDEGTSVVEAEVDDEGTSVVVETKVDDEEPWVVVGEGEACGLVGHGCGCPSTGTSGGFLLLEWCRCVPATTPPTMERMMRTITPMPHRVRYHGAFLATGS